MCLETSLTGLHASGCNLFNVFLINLRSSGRNSNLSISYHWYWFIIALYSLSIKQLGSCCQLHYLNVLTYLVIFVSCMQNRVSTASRTTELTEGVKNNLEDPMNSQCVSTISGVYREPDLHHCVDSSEPPECTLPGVS